MSKFIDTDEAYEAWLDEQAELGIVWDGILTDPIFD